MSENRNNNEFSSPPKVLIFGGTGAIGKEICSHYKVRGWDVTVTSRKPFKADDHVFWDVLTPNPSNNEQLTKALKARGQFNAVCWAQGKNCSDSIYDFDLNEHMDLYNANVTYILASLSFLLSGELLAKSSKLCVISSIWQKVSKQNKLSYCVSKSALHGLVLSLATDLAKDGHTINAVLPGVLDTPMTRQNLTEKQIATVLSGTLHNKLPNIGDVAKCVYDLCNPESFSVTGQFVSVDFGFSNAKLI